MKTFLALVAAGALMCAAPAFAADAKTTDAPKAPNTQQDKMTACNKSAGDKKGDERKAYMKTCLSAEQPMAQKPMTQGEKMSMCNKKTAGLKGDERNKAQSECMKGS